MVPDDLLSPTCAIRTLEAENYMGGQMLCWKVDVSGTTSCDCVGQGAGLQHATIWGPKAIHAAVPIAAYLDRDAAQVRDDFRFWTLQANGPRGRLNSAFEVVNSSGRTVLPGQVQQWFTIGVR